MESPQLPQPSPVPAQQPAAHPEILQLLARMRSGASWFFWIAGLSIVNSVIIVGGGDMKFVVGLGITEIIDGLAQNASSIGKGAGLFMDLCVAGIFALFGVFAKKGNTACFIIGMVIYALDGLLFLLVQEWMSIGFHVFALFCIFSGFTAQRKLVQMANAQQPVSG